MRKDLIYQVDADVIERLSLAFIDRHRVAWLYRELAPEQNKWKTAFFGGAGYSWNEHAVIFLLSG
jgi:hypothetical protein